MAPVLAILSDTHLPRGGRRLGERCVELLARADLILHAGDVTGARVLDELRRLGDIRAVRGNMDDAELQQLLPERVIVDVAGMRIGMVHDPGPRAGRAARLVARFPGCDAVVYGHTHVPERTRHEGVWILNPGSPTERRSSPSHSLLSVRVTSAGLEPELVLLPPPGG
jgi:putative phosphoesterase